MNQEPETSFLFNNESLVYYSEVMDYFTREYSIVIHLDSGAKKEIYYTSNVAKNIDFSNFQNSYKNYCDNF
jgi:hypothetical protein